MFEVNKKKKFRKAVSWEQVAIRVALFVGPQVVLQLGSLILQPATVRIGFNSDGSIGRPFCARNEQTWLTFAAYGYVCFGILVLVLLGTAHQTRGLPSLFNETRDIFDSTLGTVVILILGIGIMQVTSGPDSPASPAVNLLIRETLILTSTLNATLRVILPKLKMIWRGETVLVSKLMNDHKQSVLSKDMLYLKRKTQQTMSGASDSSVQFRDDSLPARGSEEFQDCIACKNTIVVKRDEAPDKNLVLRMFAAQAKLTQVTERIMTGSVVPEEEWIQLRQSSTRLSQLFQNEVEFYWERKKKPSKSRADEIDFLATLHQDIVLDSITEYSRETDDVPGRDLLDPADREHGKEGA